jgi:hypothetical protein
MVLGVMNWTKLQQKEKKNCTCAFIRIPEWQYNRQSAAATNEVGVMRALSFPYGAGVVDTQSRERQINRTRVACFGNRFIQ